MSTGATTLRIVHKAQYDRQIFLTPPPEKLGTLADSSVRVQSTLLGLTSNNLAYCAAGTALHWWDTFPVPEWIEAPYNDREEYGISPGWGFATIIESNRAELKAGSKLWGFFPISSFPVDLLLKPSSGLSTHFIEYSSHRSQVMPLYQRYMVDSLQQDVINAEVSMATWKALLKPVWGSSYMFNRFNFASLPGVPVLHPGLGHPWTAEDADLKKSLVICLGAGSKTSRSFVHQLATRRHPGSGPVAVLEVSSSPPEASPFATGQHPFPIKATTYKELHSQELSDWLFAQSVARFVIIDFAGRTGVCEALTMKLRANTAGIAVEVLIVGAESKVYNSQELNERLATISRVNGVRCNASGIREDAIAAIGEAKFFEESDACFEEDINGLLSVDRNRVLGIKLDVHKGLRGSEGLEGAWTRQCHGQIPADEGLVFFF